MKDRYFEQETEDFYLKEYERMVRVERPKAIKYGQNKRHLELVMTKLQDSIGLKIKTDHYGNTTFFAEAVVNGSNEIIPDNPNEMHIQNLDPVHVRNILPSFINAHWPELINVPTTVYNSQLDMKSSINPIFQLKKPGQIEPTKPAKAS